MSIKKSTYLNLTYSLSQILIVFITIPLYIGKLGIEIYGILSFILVLMGLYSLFDFGISKYVIVNISKNKNFSSRNRIASNSLFGGMIFGLIISSAGIFVLNIIPEEWLNNILDANNIKEISIILVLLIIPIQVGSNVVAGVLDGLGNFFISNLSQIISYSILQLIPLAIIYIFESSLNNLIAAIFLSKILGLMILSYSALSSGISFRYYLSIYKNIKIAILRNKILTVNNYISYLSENIDKYLVTSMLGAANLAIYSIPYNLLLKSRLLPEAISRSSLPKYAEYNYNSSIALCKNLTRFQLSASILLLIIFNVFGPIFYKIWVPSLDSAELMSISFVISIGLIINCSGYASYTLLEATNKSYILLNIYKKTTVIYLIYLVIFTYKFGIIGVAVSWTIRVGVDTFLLIYYVLGKKVAYSIAINSVIFFLAVFFIWYTDNILYNSLIALPIVIYNGLKILKYYFYYKNYYLISK